MIKTQTQADVMVEATRDFAQVGEAMAAQGYTREILEDLFARDVKFTHNHQKFMKKANQILDQRLHNPRGIHPRDRWQTLITNYLKYTEKRIKE